MRSEVQVSYMGRSLVGEQRKLLAPTTASVMVEKVLVGERKRPLDQRVVDELARSIPDEGLLQPIGVRERNEGGYDLIYGLHRLKAYEALYDRAVAAVEDQDKPTAAELQELGRWQLIPANVYPSTMPNEWVEAYERIENLRRAELTKEERQRLAGEHGKWLERQKGGIRANGPNSGIRANGPNSEVRTNGPNSEPESKRGPKADPWFQGWYSSGNIAPRTAKNWWKDFLSSTDRKQIAPGKAEEPIRAAFFAWLAEAEEKRQQAQAEAEEKARKLEEQKARDKRKNALISAFRAVAEADGDTAAFDAIREAAPDHQFTVKPNLRAVGE